MGPLMGGGWGSAGSSTARFALAQVDNERA
jgi:hypothetical protein